jgi:Protein of unknown function (DUF2844)
MLSYIRLFRSHVGDLVALCLMLVCTSSSWAALGGAPMNFVSAATSTTSVLSTGSANYSVRDTQLPGGTQVAEYIDASGKVFAVTWHGPFLPDLRSLLGPHFSAYLAESPKHPKAGNSHLSVDQTDLVIESSGHMRAFDGSAWRPSLLPSGFTVDRLR